MEGQNLAVMAKATSTLPYLHFPTSNYISHLPVLHKADSTPFPLYINHQNFHSKAKQQPISYSHNRGDQLKKMEVKIIETVPIRPSDHPFSEDHSLPLSRLDTDPNLDVTFRYVRVYANNNNTTTKPTTTGHQRPFDVIAAALSRALVHYYPLAAALRFRDGRLEVLCSRDKLALPLVNATVNAPLASVNYLDDPDSAAEFADRLAPDPSPDKRLVQPFMLQVTMFECGGFALGTAAHHALCDGMGATLFFNAAAELARGASVISVEPVWDRGSFFRPRDPPRVGGLVREVLGREEGMVGPDDVGDQVVGEYCFDVRDEWVEGLKSDLVEKSGSKFTTFEGLGAFIWRAKVKASGIPAHEMVKFVYSINIRKLVKPPLPAGYWGNGCVPMYVQLQVKDLLEQPIWRTAELIKQSKQHVAIAADEDGYVNSFINFLELQGSSGKVMVDVGRSGLTSGFTDWRHLGHSGVDFGWGGPVTIFPVSTRRLLGSDEPCFFLPHSSVGEGKGGGVGGFKVLVRLQEAAMPGFKIEIDRFCRREFGKL